MPPRKSAKKPAAKKPAAKKPAAKKPAAKKPSAAPASSGFGPETFAFLRDLERHNERAWFEANRERYERHVRGPALAFVSTMAPTLQKFAPHFVADPRPVGGSLMRIFRDTRFSADKTPYKTNVGIHFRHGVGKDVHAPGIYIHIDNNRCFLGIGLWKPEPEALAKIRNRIATKPDLWRKAISGAAFNKIWAIEGESLVRVPKGYDAEHPHADDLRRKDHIAAATIEPSMLAGAGAAKQLGARFDVAKPYLEFLCNALELPL